MDIKKQEKKKPKKVKGFALDEKSYSEFRDECQKLNLSMSEIIGEFIRRVVRVIRDGGGEVVFGIEGKNHRQPKKILYDGKEIIEKDGTRQLKEEAKE